MNSPDRVTPINREQDAELQTTHSPLFAITTKKSAGRIFTSRRLGFSNSLFFVGYYGLQAGVQPSHPPMITFPPVTVND